MAVAGVFANNSRWQQFHSSVVHSHDCAVFMTLASVALPKYRAIMGPFRWEVWMAITFAYLLAILPMSFSAYHTLRPLLDNPYELENMFWHVFGTFTNCFTFSGKKSWTSGKKNSTRIFIGTYWAFSIIISTAYTGSIIAFIMLPNFPEVIETAHQLVEEDLRLIVTNKSDLRMSVLNSTNVSIQRLYNKMKIVDSVEEAISNVTESPLFTDYAFLHSREFLKHVIRTNFSAKMSHKKSVFHLSQKCFLPMLVAMMFQPESNLVKRVNVLLMRAIQGGFINKLVSDVAWDQQKTSSGKLLQVSGGGINIQPPEERQLTLDDTQGMFLLLGIGFGLAIIALMTECCVYVWTKRTRVLSVPSIVYSETDKHLGNRNFQFQNKEDFLRYFNSQSSNSLLELPMENSLNDARIVRSLTILKLEHQEHCNISASCPSI
ncbi:hypothetical protein J6590_052074 [Homalodisca vitripennis]|nr:hypothetical protein J6590_052074 [Homalodisca vitripennis]